MNLLDRILMRLAYIWAIETHDTDTQAFLGTLLQGPLTHAQRKLLAEYTCQKGELEATRLAEAVRGLERRRAAAALS